MPVYRTDSGKAGAALVFRVGQADETLPRRGLTHLVEHLVLSPATGEPGVGGHVDLLTTMLLFEGSDGDVREHLRRAAAAIADPPAERLDVERRVLTVEDAAAGPDAYLLQLWYGARGPGLAYFKEFGLRDVTPGDVAEHARQWFCRGNAALVLAGGVDAGDLELPPGPRRPAQPPAARGWATPAEVPRPGSPLGLAAPVPDTAEVAVLAGLLERRVWSALRHERGLAYDVRCRTPAVGASQRLLAIVSDVDAPDASPAAEALVEQVRAIADGRFSDAELAAASRQIDRAGREAEPLHLLAVVASSELVRGRVKMPAETLAELREVTRDGVVGAAQALAGRMLLACPSGATSSQLRPIQSEEHPPVAGRRFRRRLVPRHMEAVDVVVGEEGVSALIAEDAAVTVRFAGCVAALRELDGGLSLVGEDGQVVTLDPGDLRDGREAVAAAEARLDASVVVGLDERSARVQASAGRGLRPVIVGESSELLAPLLGSDEQLIHTAEATQGIRPGVLAVTDRRVLFVGKLFSEHVVDIPLRSIERLRRRPNPLWPSLVLEQRTGSSKFSFMTVPRVDEAAAAIDAARSGATG